MNFLHSSSSRGTRPLRRQDAKEIVRHFRSMRCVLGLFATLLLAVASSPAAEVSKELQVKCSYLHNFTKFIDWPSQAFNSEDSPLVIGVYGNDLLKEELERQTKNRSVGTRKFLVKKINQPEEVSTVHLLYISDTPDPACSRLLAAAATQATLTVGDTEQFGRSGGIIRFILEEGKVRFEIDQSTAETVKLKLSPQLLKLARVVRKK